MKKKSYLIYKSKAENGQFLWEGILCGNSMIKRTTDKDFVIEGMKRLYDLSNSPRILSIWDATTGERIILEETE